MFHRKCVSNTNGFKIYRTNYLKDGRVMFISIKEQAELNQGQVEVVGIIKNSCMVDSAGRLTWVQRHKTTLTGLVKTFTARGVRTEKFGDFNAFIGDEEFRASVLSEGVMSPPQHRYYFNSSTQLSS